MTRHITGAYKASDGRIVATCWCGWWSNDTPALVALRWHQAETGHDDNADPGGAP